MAVVDHIGGRFASPEAFGRRCLLAGRSWSHFGPSDHQTTSGCCHRGQALAKSPERRSTYREFSVSARCNGIASNVSSSLPAQAELAQLRRRTDDSKETATGILLQASDGRVRQSQASRIGRPFDLAAGVNAVACSPGVGAERALRSARPSLLSVNFVAPNRPTRRTAVGRQRPFVASESSQWPNSVPESLTRLRALPPSNVKFGGEWTADRGTDQR